MIEIMFFYVLAFMMFTLLIGYKCYKAQLHLNKVLVKSNSRQHEIICKHVLQRRK